MTNTLPCIKCTLIGDAGVGKTKMLIAYVTCDFHEDYLPRAVDCWERNLMVDGSAVHLFMYDPPRPEDDSERVIEFNPVETTDVAIICFSLMDRTSFNSVKATHWPRVHDLNDKRRSDATGPSIPMVLVGAKLDMRREWEDAAAAMPLLPRRAAGGNPSLSDKTCVGNAPVTHEEGLAMAQELGAVTYVECSAKTQECLMVVFDEAVRAALRRPLLRKRGAKCAVL